MTLMAYIAGLLTGFVFAMVLAEALFGDDDDDDDFGDGV